MKAEPPTPSGILLSETSVVFSFAGSVFFSVFPQFAGQPFRKYVASKRIVEAQMLIRTYPDRPISQIADAVGYIDDSTFYRNFLQITGVTPSKYRAGCR